MENYVLLYHFDEKESITIFEREINKEFLRHRIEENNDLKYFGFADKDEPEVVDKLNAIISGLVVGTKDYVALYYSREEDPDKIKRRMLIGHDDLIENVVKNISFDSHRNSLTKLLNFDYVGAYPEPSK